MLRWVIRNGRWNSLTCQILRTWRLTALEAVMPVIDQSRPKLGGEPQSCINRPPGRETQSLAGKFSMRNGFRGEEGMADCVSLRYADGKYDLDFENEKSDSSKELSGGDLAALYQSFIKVADA